MTHIRHPATPREIAERDRLLQATMRPFAASFPIAQEYPTVLSAQDVRYSWGLYADNRCLVAHANLWPRVLRDHETGFQMDIGLVGNVATDLACQGQGHMSHLLEQLVVKAKESGLQALILWSDLSEFYQKRGFSSCSSEKRYTFRISSLLEGRKAVKPFHGFRSMRPQTIDPDMLLRSRYPVPATLVRSSSDCTAQLKTVGLRVFCGRPLSDGSLPFVCMGKGCDLVSVIHEWGASSPQILLEGLSVAGKDQRFDEVMLLAPDTLPQAWDDDLRERAFLVETHPMALVRVLNDTPQTRATLGRAFIWGLDSI